MNRKKKKVVGAIAIEAVLSLTIFMIAILALMMGSLLMRAQSSMQYALNQTAKEISGYFYLLDKFGIASMLSENTTDSADADLDKLNTTIGHIFAFSGDLKGDAETIKNKITETNEQFQSGTLTKEDLDELKAIPKDEMGKIEDNIDTITDDIELLKSTDKKVLFKAVIQVFSRACINTAASKYLTPFVCRALMPKYLTAGDVNEYYNSIGVLPGTINFDGSHILGDGRTIALVVEYQVDASKLTLGFYRKNLTFRHVAVTSAWIQKNESGSLQDLQTVGKYYSEGYIKERGEELKLLSEAKAEAEAEADKKKKEEAEEVSKALTKPTTTSTTSTTEVTEKSEDTTTTTTTTAPLTKEAEEFLKKYPQCKALYEKYGPDVIEAVNKCSDPNAAITLLLNAENGKPSYGADAIQALKKDGDDAVAALKKVPSKDCAVAIVKCDGASKVIVDHGEKAVSAITRGFDYDNAQGVVDALIACGDDVFLVFDNDKIKLTKECTKLLVDYDDDAILVISELGNDAVKAVCNCKSDTGKRNALSVIISHGNDGLRIVDQGGENLVNAIAKADKTTQKEFVQVVKGQNDEFIQSVGKWSATDDAIKMVVKFKEKSAPIIDQFQGQKVVGLGTVLDNNQLNAVTFVQNVDGTVYVAGSGMYLYNPSISVPKNYVTDDSLDSEYYYDKYNYLLTEEGIKMMNVSKETEEELRKLNEAIETAKEAAASSKKGKIYEHGGKDGKEVKREPSFYDNRSVCNCGEVWAAREAILNGAKFDDIKMKTWCNNTLNPNSPNPNSTKTGDYMPMCDNCKITFKGKKLK